MCKFKKIYLDLSPTSCVRKGFYLFLYTISGKMRGNADYLP